MPSLPSTFTGDNTGAAIVVSPSGRFVYASNRGHDSVAIFRVDESNGMLSPVGWESTKGSTPRFIGLTPAGTRLFAANQRSDSIVEFRVDQATGTLSATGQVVTVNTPVCIVFRSGTSPTPKGKRLREAELAGRGHTRPHCARRRCRVTGGDTTSARMITERCRIPATRCSHPAKDAQKCTRLQRRPVPACPRQSGSPTTSVMALALILGGGSIVLFAWPGRQSSCPWGYPQAPPFCGMPCCRSCSSSSTASWSGDRFELTSLP